jgi:hypothetical protein
MWFKKIGLWLWRAVPILCLVILGFLYNEFGDLQFKVWSTEYSLEKIKPRLDTVETDVRKLKYSQNEFAVLSPDEKGFSKVDTPIGPLLFSLGDMKPYADGYRVNIEIGNPNNATFKDLKLKIKWGARYDYKKQLFSEWEKSLRVKETTISKAIKPGTWNKVSVILSPASASEVGTLRFSAESNKISLHAH